MCYSAVQHSAIKQVSTFQQIARVHAWLLFSWYRVLRVYSMTAFYTPTAYRGPAPIYIYILAVRSTHACIWLCPFPFLVDAPLTLIHVVLTLHTPELLRQGGLLNRLASFFCTVDILEPTDWFPPFLLYTSTFLVNAGQRMCSSSFTPKALEPPNRSEKASLTVRTLTAKKQRTREHEGEKLSRLAIQ